MAIEVNEAIGQVTETITLPEGGKVTGELTIAWQTGGRARVSADKVEYRGKVYSVDARFQQHEDVWVFQPEAMSAPVRKPGGIFGEPAAQTFTRAILDACGEALREAFSVDTARTVGLVTTRRDLEEALSEEAELVRQLAKVRARIGSLRKQEALYGG